MAFETCANSRKLSVEGLFAGWGLSRALFGRSLPWQSTERGMLADLDDRRLGSLT
jgi:hypothetical protein